MAIDPNILRRIRACLALSQSPEPHEAAAMRQAEALMRLHGISRADVAMADVREAEAEAVCGRGNLLPDHLALLAWMVADVLGCTWYVSRPHTAAFVGVGPAAEIAAYAYTTLGRQLLSARATHRRRSTRGAAHKRSARADAWAVGWVSGVRRLVVAIAPTRPVAVDQYMAVRHADLVTSTSRPKRDPAHVAAGWMAGRTSGVRLHHGVGIADAVPAIERQ